jgi:hypothetical protein
MRIVSRADSEFVESSCKKSETVLVDVGRFNLDYLAEMVEILSEDTLGDIDIKMIPADVSRTGATLLIAKYGENDYVALAGIRTSPVDIEKVDGILIPKQPDGV